MIISDIHYAKHKETERQLHKAQRTIIEQMREIEGLKQQLSCARAMIVGLGRKLILEKEEA